MAAINIYNISKCYRLGVIGRQTLQDEFRYWWHRTRGRDPNFYMGKVGGSKKFNQETSQVHNQEFWALRNISLDIDEGEVVGIIGKNGAGKSTLLKILSKITEPTSGEAIINGRVASLLEVGTGFHPELTGRENIFLNGAILGMSRKEIRKKLDEIVAFAELEKFIDTPVKRYSSGMYVRLAFAVAAHLEPEILLIDEVLAVGDSEFQKKCLGKMGEVAGQGRTVIFVSHNMSAVTRLCPRTILINQGRLVDNGPSVDVVSSYLRREGTCDGARHWDDTNAPGDSSLRLYSVLLRGANGESVSSLSVEDDAMVELRYRVLEPGLQFRCAVIFYAQGVCAFPSIQPSETIYEASGEYVARILIPSHLLSECEYTVGISIFTSRGLKHHYVKLDDVMQFSVHDPVSGKSSRGDYVQPLAGVVRPLLQWELSKEESGAEV